MKLKLSTYQIATGAVWAACLGFFIFGTLQISGPQKAALEKTKLDLQESREKLLFSQSAKKGETLQRMQERLEAARGSLDTFSCPASEESTLIFQVGQLARTLQLKKFTSHSLENARENTLEKSDLITEGWLAVEFVADYLKLAAFVNSLERQSPALFIESISVKQSDNNKEEALVRMALSYLTRNDNTVHAVACAPIAH